MKLNWKEIIDALGTLGVIGSLVFVALEIQQNTDAIRSAAIQDISRWSYDASLANLEYPEVLQARRAICGGNISDDQRVVLSVYYVGLLRIQLNRFQQVKLGILDESEALDLGGRGGAYRNPFFAGFWAEIKDTFDPEFVDFIERELLPLSGSGCLQGF